eukprot:4400858-Pyramimonas_sp.AAC.1
MHLLGLLRLAENSLGKEAALRDGLHLLDQMCWGRWQNRARDGRRNSRDALYGWPRGWLY